MTSASCGQKKPPSGSPSRHRPVTQGSNTIRCRKKARRRWSSDGPSSLGANHLSQVISISLRSPLRTSTSRVSSKESRRTVFSQDRSPTTSVIGSPLLALAGREPAQTHAPDIVTGGGGESQRRRHPLIEPIPFRLALLEHGTVNRQSAGHTRLRPFNLEENPYHLECQQTLIFGYPEAGQCYRLIGSQLDRDFVRRVRATLQRDIQGRDRQYVLQSVQRLHEGKIERLSGRRFFAAREDAPVLHGGGDSDCCLGGSVSMSGASQAARFLTWCEGGS